MSTITPLSKEDIDWENIKNYKEILQLPDEVWLPIEGYEQQYISNYGRVKSYSMKKPIIKFIGDNGNGYKTVSMIGLSVGSLKGKPKTCYIHRLVAGHFLPNPDNLPQVNHTRGGFGKQDNRAEVLEWCTGKDNILDAHDNGQMDYRTKVKTSIDVKPDEFVIAMYRRYKETGRVGETAREFGVPRTSLSSIVNKRSRVKITDDIDNEYKITKEQPHEHK